MLDHLEIVLRMLTGLGLGLAIGLERQWRARNAGIRTNALVSLGSTLFVIMGGFTFDGGQADPTRVAAQVVSGIGFLGAGVIMKQGASISGLNTAATLWASAAVGALAGGGMYFASACGAAAVMATNTLLRPLARKLDQRGDSGREPVCTEYQVEVRCSTDAEVLVRSQVFDAMQRPGFSVRSIEARDLPDSIVEIDATVTTDDRDDSELETAISHVIRNPDVLSVKWTAQELFDTD